MTPSSWSSDISAGGMKMAMADLQQEFTRALERHLADGGEAALLSAYELGRRTLAARLGVLDVPPCCTKPSWSPVSAGRTTA